MARPDTTEGQAVWQPGGAEEDSRFCEGDRHLHVAYDEEEEADQREKSTTQKVKSRIVDLKIAQDSFLLLVVCKELMHIQVI